MLPQQQDDQMKNFNACDMWNTPSCPANGAWQILYFNEISFKTEFIQAHSRWLLVVLPPKVALH